MRKPRHIIGLIVGVLGVVAIGTGTGYAMGYRINMTSSVPIGLYRIEGDGRFSRGQIVALCPPDNAAFQLGRARGYVLGGYACPGGYRPLFKPVAALAGDMVTVAPEGISVNGRLLPNTRARPKDGEGRPLPVVTPGAHRVMPGQIWVISTYNARSFDGRYFGAIPASGIMGVARPIYTVQNYPGES